MIPRFLQRQVLVHAIRSVRNARCGLCLAVVLPPVFADVGLKFFCVATILTGDNLLPAEQG